MTKWEEKCQNFTFLVISGEAEDEEGLSEMSLISL
jgi:hypothetical protein